MIILRAILIVVTMNLAVALFVLSLPAPKPDPPPTKKYCTIKLNDTNNQTSYLTGECISNE